MNGVFVIIPVLNEANNIANLAKQLVTLAPQPDYFILVDGGSKYDTVAEINYHFSQVGIHNFFTLTAPRGRASQQNKGAFFALHLVKQNPKPTEPYYLLFLHADTRLPKDAIALVTSAMSLKPNKAWGRFDVKIDSKQLLLKLVSMMINVRSKYTKVATGDQAIFVEAGIFERINGFKDIPLMEDVALCKKLRKHSKPVCLQHKVITSARRWEKHGILKTILLMWQLRFEYWIGVSTDKLAIKYGYQPRDKKPKDNQ